MRRTSFTAAAFAIACGSMSVAGGAGPALAQPAAAGPTVLPFTQILRRCDFTQFQYTSAGFYGRPVGELRVEGGDVVVDLRFATGAPNARYDVRLIQSPRPDALRCNAGDPGVVGAVLLTNNIGGAATTVRAPIMPGAEGAWVSITRADAYSQIPQEFYTTDAIAAI